MSERFVLYSKPAQRPSTEVEEALRMARLADPQLVDKFKSFGSGEQACAFMAQMRDQNARDTKKEKTLPNLHINVDERPASVIRHCSITKYGDDWISSTLAHFELGGTNVVTEYDRKTPEATRERRDIITDLAGKESN